MTTFYTRKALVPVSLPAVEKAEINVVNSGGKLEAYSEDLRKMHVFAAVLKDVVARKEGPPPPV